MLHPGRAFAILAVVVLEKFSDQEVVPDLIALLDHQDANVRHASHHALESLTGVNIEASSRAWIEWLDEEETALLHPVDRAARAHWKLMSIYPFTKNSGKVARLLQNLMLLRDGFPPIVIHSIERQRYYDVLRSETAGLVPLVLESLENGVETSTRFFAELEETKQRRRRAS